MNLQDRIQRDAATILSIIKYVLIAAMAIVLVYLGFRLFVILIPFVFGFIMARLAVVIVTGSKTLIYNLKLRSKSKQSELSEDTKQQKKWVPYPRGLARSRGEKRLIIFVYFLLIILIIAAIVGVVIAGIGQLRSLAAYLPDFFRNKEPLQSVIDYLESISEKLGVIEPQYLDMIKNELVRLQGKLIESIPTVVGAILNGIASFASSLPVIFFAIIVAIMSGYYFIVDSRRLYVFMRRNVVSKQFREKTVRLVDSLSTTLFRVIGGYVLLFVLTFAMALVGLILIRMPYPVVFALIAAIVDLLPVLGLAATLIPIAIYQFAIGHILGGLGALILLGVMTTVRRVIEPPILGGAMHLHPMATLASMIIGVAVYGLAGILIGPVILVIAKEVITLYGIDEKLRSFFGDLLNRVIT